MSNVKSCATVKSCTEVKSHAKVVTTADGDSAFEDAELPLDEHYVSEGTPSMLVAALAPAQPVTFLRFPAFDDSPHTASEPQWVVVLRGVIEVEVSDGTARRFGAGELVLATDTTGRGHSTRIVGDGPFEALMIPAAAP
jgi:hypothetical protein